MEVPNYDMTFSFYKSLECDSERVAELVHGYMACLVMKPQGFKCDGHPEWAIIICRMQPSVVVVDSYVSPCFLCGAPLAL